MITTQCPKCQTNLSDQHANILEAVLTCPNCAHELPLLETLLNLEDKAYKQAFLKKEGIQITRADDLRIRLKPSTSAFSSMPFLFGLIVIGMAAILYYVSLDDPNQHPIYNPGISTIILAFLLLVGTLVILDNLRRLVQHTYIRVDRRKARFRTPLFGWIPFGWKSIRSDRFQQLFVVELKKDPDKGRSVLSYSVKGLLENGKQVALVSGLKKAADAFFVERELETYLNIKDQIRPKEYVPPSRTQSGRSSTEALPYEIKEPVLKGHPSVKEFIFTPCPTCGESLDDALINQDENVIQCSKCKTVEALEGLQFSSKNAEALLKKIKSPEQARNIMTEEGHGLKLTIRPRLFSRKFINLLSFQAVLNVIVFSIYFSAQNSASTSTWGQLLYLSIILVPLFSLGAIARHLGMRDIIEVDRLQITSYKQLFGQYTLKEKAVQNFALDQLFVKEYSYKPNDSPSVTNYQLYARLKGGKEVLVQKELHSSEQAFYLEHKIETYLGIQDREIEGAYLPAPLGAPEQPPADLDEIFKALRRKIDRM
jgi:DNA-directed RNA polymerase subunit M/transcription elongation factor TFIIS